MRLAFVLRLGNDTRPAEGVFEGWIEEVDSCTEVRFRSTEQLVKFLGQRFDLAMTSTGKTRATDSKQAPIEKRQCRKGKRSP